MTQLSYNPFLWCNLKSSQLFKNSKTCPCQDSSQTFHWLPILACNIVPCISSPQRNRCSHIHTTMCSQRLQTKFCCFITLWGWGSKCYTQVMCAGASGSKCPQWNVLQCPMRSTCKSGGEKVKSKGKEKAGGRWLTMITSWWQVLWESSGVWAWAEEGCSWEADEESKLRKESRRTCYMETARGPAENSEQSPTSIVSWCSDTVAGW